MNFKALASLASAMCLAACAATSADSGSSASAESEATATDASTDASVSPDASDAGPAVATYAEEAPVIQQHCGGCHSTKFNTLAKVVQNRAKMVQELQQQKMPKDDTTWSTTPDGQTFLDFLENSPELN